MQKFLSELQRRKVLRVASGYVVAGWIILQVALSLQAAMKLSESFSTYIVSLLILGFPVSLVLSWFFEITPEGVRRTVAAEYGAPVRPQVMDMVLAAALGLVVVMIGVGRMVPTPVPPAERPDVMVNPVSASSIAVMPFADLSPEGNQAYFSDGISEEILNVLAHTDGRSCASSLRL